MSERESLCASLYPGGHGEDRECILPKDHAGPHDYKRLIEPKEGWRAVGFADAKDPMGLFDDE